MSDLAHAASFTGGAGVFLGATNDQNERPFSMSMTYFGAAGAAPSRGSGAPILTHASKSAITWSGSFSFGGIAVSLSLYRSARMSLLRSGLPGRMLGPVVPLLRSPSLESG